MKFLSLKKLSLFVIIIAISSLNSCETVHEPVVVTLVNKSSKSISAYLIESGYINTFEDAIYEFGLGGGIDLARGEQSKISINVSENGSGDFEAIKITITADSVEYSNEYSYLYYYDDGTNSTMTATISDANDSTVYISFDFGL